MENVVIDFNNQKYASILWKGIKQSNTVFIYFHGLDGKAKITQPLQKILKDYDFYSIEQRGHLNSLQKSSISVKKHDNDLKNIVNYMKSKYENIYLIGESMGAIYTARYGYTHNDIKGVFCWSIPFQPKDIIKENIWKKAYIIFRTILTFFTAINYKYRSTIDYPKLTNSKFLLKLNELDTNTQRQTSEAVALWKANFKLKRWFLTKKPKSPIYYWHGEDDFMTNKKLITKIQNKNKVYFEIVPNSKHILMFEKNFYLIENKIIEVINDK